jgi:hypothetical protein
MIYQTVFREVFHITACILSEIVLSWRPSRAVVCNSVLIKWLSAKTTATDGIGRTFFRWTCNGHYNRYFKIYRKINYFLRSATAFGPIPLAARLLGLRVRISPRIWMSVSCKCWVLSGRGLCVGLITRLEESYRVWCGVVWCGVVCEASIMRRPWPTRGCCATGKKYCFYNNTQLN